MPQVKKVSNLKGHTDRATDVAFSPTDNCIATASADRTARLWNTEGSLLKKFDGHLDRLARIAFHPSGRYLGTTSYDKTWRLWDIDTGEELLLQEGHSRSVYGLSFHHDGSLAASCGLDALARVWDLRSGRSILALEGHVKPVRLKLSNIMKVSFFLFLFLLSFDVIFVESLFCCPLSLLLLLSLYSFFFYVIIIFFGVCGCVGGLPKSSH